MLNAFFCHLLMFAKKNAQNRYTSANMSNRIFASQILQFLFSFSLFFGSFDISVRNVAPFVHKSTEK